MCDKWRLTNETGEARHRFKSWDRKQAKGIEFVLYIRWLSHARHQLKCCWRKSVYLSDVASSFLSYICLFLQVKMWVQLLIPRIEDGNNFGVSIQEETVAELRTVEGEAASYLDQISRFAEPCRNPNLIWTPRLWDLSLKCEVAFMLRDHFCLSSLLPDTTSQGQSWFLK